MTSPTTDVIDLLVGITAGSPLDRLRAERPETRLNAQKSYQALFEPAHQGDVTQDERLAIAVFVTGLHAAADISGFYASGLTDKALATAVGAEVEKGRTHGPYGRYPAGPLSSEDRAGLVYEVSGDSRNALGPKLAAALEHSHLLVFRPRESNAGALQKLLDAGWTTTGVVTLSQIVAFLAFQIRVVTGLKALATATAQSLSA
ncbi:CMD domain protein [Rhizobium sp. AP16]|uniref:CMD domain protein n=1 Tax=Rhizobium sp. AP16 TaxID=1144306 RepID=UPI00026EDBE7|nr:CMD domain protein [Rhizobium sp. AP16]EJK87466.1 CMD domain protein, Avi_7170 family [Rhizobium sp. AP16]